MEGWGCITSPPSWRFWSQPPCEILGPLCAATGQWEHRTTVVPSHTVGAAPVQDLAVEAASNPLSSWQHVGSHTKGMWKLPIKSLSCSPPSSHGPHRTIYKAPRSQGNKTETRARVATSRGVSVIRAESQRSVPEMPPGKAIVPREVPLRKRLSQDHHAVSSTDATPRQGQPSSHAGRATGDAAAMSSALWWPGRSRHELQTQHLTQLLRLPTEGENNGSSLHAQESQHQAAHPLPATNYPHHAASKEAPGHLSSTCSVMQGGQR